MEMAYGLAEKARGRTSPNPLRRRRRRPRRRIVGHGYHEGPGEPHAEIIALGRAGTPGRGGDALRDPRALRPLGPDAALRRHGARRRARAGRRLGPRSQSPRPHQGRPPARSGRARRLGRPARGAERGAQRGLRQVHRPARSRSSPSRRPRASTARSPPATGDSHWISSAATRDYVHLLRGEQDAILVGAGTLVADDPLLTVRHPELAGQAAPPRGPRLRACASRDGARLLATLGRRPGPRLRRPAARRPAGPGPSRRAAPRSSFPADGADGWTSTGVLAELGRREHRLAPRRGRRPGGHLVRRGPPRRQGRPDLRAAAHRRRGAPRVSSAARAPAAVGLAATLTRTRSFTVADDIVVEGILLMFTGIISHQGRFRGFREGRTELAVEAPGLGRQARPATASPSTASA